VKFCLMVLSLTISSQVLCKDKDKEKRFYVLDRISCTQKKPIDISKIKIINGRFLLGKKAARKYNYKDRDDACKIELDPKFKGTSVFHKIHSFELQSTIPNKYSKLKKKWKPKMILFSGIGDNPISSIQCFQQKGNDKDDPKHMGIKDINDMLSGYFTCKLTDTFNQKLRSNEEIHLRELWSMRVVDGNRVRIDEKRFLDDFNSIPYVPPKKKGKKTKKKD